MVNIRSALKAEQSKTIYEVRTREAAKNTED